MTVLKKNINLHSFTAPSADTNTAAAEEKRTVLIASLIDEAIEPTKKEAVDRITAMIRFSKRKLKEEKSCLDAIKRGCTTCLYTDSFIRRFKGLFREITYFSERIDDMFGTSLSKDAIDKIADIVTDEIDQDYEVKVDDGEDEE